ncbi:hypothetical protein D9M72_261060 [compost metagenome]
MDGGIEQLRQTDIGVGQLGIRADIETQGIHDAEQVELGVEQTGVVSEAQRDGSAKQHAQYLVEQTLVQPCHPASNGDGADGLVECGDGLDTDRAVGLKEGE